MFPGIQYILNDISDEMNEDELSSGPESSNEEDDFFQVALNLSEEGSKLLLLDNICPADCNPKLFEMAYGLRAMRLTFEANLQQEHDSLFRSSKAIENYEEDDRQLTNELKRENEKMAKLMVGFH